MSFLKRRLFGLWLELQCNLSSFFSPRLRVLKIALERLKRGGAEFAEEGEVGRSFILSLSMSFSYTSRRAFRVAQCRF